MAAAKSDKRYGHRNATLILIMYRHSLRVCEVIALRWDQINLKEATVHVNRRKNGKPSVQPLRGPELRALRKLKRDFPDTSYVFVSERKGPLSERSIHHIVAKAGQKAGLSLPCHPHMLRHSTGYYLAGKKQDTRAIQDYLGHRNIQSTVRYTELVPDRFKDFWMD